MKFIGWPSTKYWTFYSNDKTIFVWWDDGELYYEEIKL